MGMKSNLVFLKHIIEEIDFVTKETKGIRWEEFMQNEVLKRACTRSLEIIGEAVKNLSPEFRNRFTNIEWKKIAGLRDKVIHFYFGVNWDVVWDVIEKRLPALKEQIENILAEIGQANEA